MEALSTSFRVRRPNQTRSKGASIVGLLKRIAFDMCHTQNTNSRYI
jgi:hypothetical protein